MRDIFPHNLSHLPEGGLKIISHCPICHFKYDPLEARVLSENREAHLIYFKCRQCSAAILALILANNFGLSSFGLLTDLDGSEIMRIKDSDAIKSDDVLAAYQLLNSPAAGEFLIN